MIKLVAYCDRCGNMCEELRNNRGFHIFRNKYFVRTNKDAYLDLCQDCYDSLAKWMELGKAESEE